MQRLNIYQAPNPYAISPLSIVVRVLFPPILLWDGLKWVANQASGQAVGGLILPAQDIFKRPNAQIGAVPSHVDGLSIQKFRVRTYDGIVLDGCEIRNPHNQKKAKSEQRYIINFVGNAACYENILSQMVDDAKELGCNVVGFNYRGVAHSAGRATSKDDLVTDGIAQVQRLLDDGVNPENIMLKGRSLGGAVGTLVAAHFHEKGIKVNVFNERSFSSITNVISGQIRGNESVGRKILGWLAWPFIRLGLALSKWEMNAADAFKSIPDTHKEYLVVRPSKEQKATLGMQDDPIITHYGSLHVGLTDKRRAEKSTIRKSLITDQEKDEAIKRLNERKMTVARGGSEHNEPAKYLRDRYRGKDANHFFRSFFEKAQHKHEEAKKAPDEKGKLKR